MGNTFYYLGCPGTGKTATLRASAEKNASLFGGEAVAACSYTKAAAAVLSSREFPLPEKNIGTLHSFAYRALGRPKLTVGKENDFTSAHPAYRLSPERTSFVDPLSIAAAINPGDRLQSQMEILRAQLKPRTAWPDNIRKFADAWDSWKAENELLDFTDLLETCLRDVDAMPGDPACLIVDEVQDSTAVQLALIDKWGSRTEKVILAGDSGQCLYSFAGATPEALESIPIKQQHTLPQSYRLPRTVHAFAESWLNCWHPTKFAGREYAPRPADGAVTRCSASWMRPEAAIDLAEKYIVAGKTVMILATAHYLLNPTLAVLRKRCIPFHNQYRPEDGAWNPLRHGTEKIHTAVDRLLAFLNAWDGNAVWLWASIMEAKGHLLRGAKNWLAELKGNRETIDMMEFTRWMDPAFADTIWKFSFGTQDQTNWSVNEWWNALLPKSRKILDYPCRLLCKHGKQILTTTPQLTLGTCHSVKGGEAQVVIIFPDVSPAGWREWTSGAAGRGAIVRTIYVGMTRTFEELVLCAPASSESVSWERKGS